MEIETVAVFSEADRGAFYTTLATQSFCIGGAHPDQSYLNQNALITTALSANCDAIHPGFGFLAENADFARLVRDNELRFIGLSAECIAKLGDKNATRDLMRRHGLPVIPNSEKRAPDTHVRHIEIQILADNRGNVIHLGERDCTLRWRQQKMLEEAPVQLPDDATRCSMREAALMAAKLSEYVNAGSVEFLLDDTGAFSFIEMNPRIQVGHPLTEMITGVDLIREQIRIAAGETLSYRQEDIHFKGHAIECRIYAEDPANGFTPCPGTIEHLHLPSGLGVRVDSDLHSGYVVSPYYNLMIAKIITHGHTRNEAIMRMRRALEETIISGIDTNTILHYLLMYNPDYLANHTDTSFVENNLDKLLRPFKGGITL